MNESVGYTVTINIIITFIVIVFVFLSNVLIYYKSNKVGNLITDSIEKYSGFSSETKSEIEMKLSSVGYNKTKISCGNIDNCTLAKINGSEVDTSKDGYCVYECISTYKKDKNNNTTTKPEYYYYKIKTNMMINIPIINNLVNASVFSSTGNIYNFEGVDKPATLEVEASSWDLQ